MDAAARDQLLKEAQQKQAKERQEAVDARLKQMDPNRPGKEDAKPFDPEAMARRMAVMNAVGQGVAGVGGAMARGDAGGAVEAGLGSAATVASAVGGPITAAVVGGMSTAFSGLRSIVDGLKAASDKLADVSGVNAAAQAQNEVIELLGDLKRAEIAGRELAQLSVAYTKLGQEAQTAMLELLKDVIPLLTTVLSSMAIILTVLPKFLKAWADGDTVGKITTMADLITKFLTDAKNDDKEFAVGPIDTLERFFGPGNNWRDGAPFAPPGGPRPPIGG